MRVYIPATVPLLQSLLDHDQLMPVNGTAFALTPALREAYATGDSEELEYAAMADAARASIRLLAADPDAPPRRAVISADVEGAQPRPDLDIAVVRVSAPVPMSAIAAVHVDTSEAEHAVRAATGVIDRADLGDDDAEFTVGTADDQELAWYAPQEVTFLLQLM